MNPNIPTILFLAFCAVFGVVVFWNLNIADKNVKRLSTELEVLRRRMKSIEKQIGWDGDKALTVMFERDHAHNPW